MNPEHEKVQVSVNSEKRLIMRGSCYEMQHQMSDDEMSAGPGSENRKLGFCRLKQRYTRMCPLTMPRVPDTCTAWAANKT